MPAPSLWRAPGFVPTLVAVAAAFGSWGLLLPVVPLAVLTAGGSNTLAGATTGVFMAVTVATQIVTPWALRRFGYTPVMVFAAMMLGLPAVGYAITDAAVAVLALCALRGIGFGALTVAESALVAELVPRHQLGRASGSLGLVIGFANLIGLPAGLFLFEHFGATLVYVLGAAVALIAAVMCLAIPRRRAAVVPSRTNTATKVYSVVVVVPAAAIGATAMGFGVISAFLPAAITGDLGGPAPVLTGVTFAVLGGAQMVSRFAAGVIADRRNRTGSLLLVGLLASCVGLALLCAALNAVGPGWLVVVAVGCFGAGFGVVQNEALLMMFARLPQERISEASALWNMSFDAGTGAGSLVLGMVAARLAYTGAFAAGAMIVACACVAAVAEFGFALLRRGMRG